MLRQLPLTVLGLAGGLFLGEGALRAHYPALPSVAALHDSDYEVHRFDSGGGDYACSTDLAPAGTRDLLVGSGDETRELWIVGDSVAYGQGVSAEQVYGVQLAERLADSHGVSVVVRNFGMPGAGACGVLSRLEQQLDAGARPDLVLLGLFADDLEDRALVSVQGRPVAFPDRVDDAWTRALVSQSYFANLAWFSGVMGEVEVHHRFIEPAARADFQIRMRTLVDRIEDAGGATVVSLTEPVGILRCVVPPEPGSRCDWMPDDLDLMADLLVAAEVPAVDLRGLWNADPRLMIHHERPAALPIHPNALGHARMAEALWPALDAAAGPAPDGAATSGLAAR